MKSRKGIVSFVFSYLRKARTSRKISIIRQKSRIVLIAMTRFETHSDISHLASDFQHYSRRHSTITQLWGNANKLIALCSHINTYIRRSRVHTRSATWESIPKKKPKKSDILRCIQTKTYRVKNDDKLHRSVSSSCQPVKY